MTGYNVLLEGEAAFQEYLNPSRSHGVCGERGHDCNVVATMRAHRIRRLAVRDSADFKRFNALVRVDDFVG
jgi:hypothetical protein